MRIADNDGRQAEPERQRSHEIHQHEVFIPSGSRRHRVLAANTIENDAELANSTTHSPAATCVVRGSQWVPGCGEGRGRWRQSILLPAADEGRKNHQHQHDQAGADRCQYRPFVFVPWHPLRLNPGEIIGKPHDLTRLVANGEYSPLAINLLPKILSDRLPLDGMIDADP